MDLKQLEKCLLKGLADETEIQADKEILTFWVFASATLLTNRNVVEIIAELAVRQEILQKSHVIVTKWSKTFKRMKCKLLVRDGNGMWCWIWSIPFCFEFICRLKEEKLLSLLMFLGGNDQTPLHLRSSAVPQDFYVSQLDTILGQL